MFPRKSLIAALAAVALLQLASTGLAGGATDEQAGRPQTSDVVRGQAAIDRVGRNLAKIAEQTGLEPDALRRMFLEDNSLGVNAAGDVEIVEPQPGNGSTISTGKPDTLIYPATDTFRLHSRASSRKIYLDFTGHTTTGTQWNSSYGATITTPPWTRDASASVSTAEAAAIQSVWAHVAEDFASFNVDVTTEDPGVEGLRRTTSTDTAYGIRLVIGPENWYPPAAGGVAYLGSFNWTSDTPAFCFANSTWDTKSIAECVSHEAGHTVNLLHDGRTSPVEEYYPGHANWAPIMGVGYYKPVTQWSRGEYSAANNTQNDVTIATGFLGAVTDDYPGNTTTTATLPSGTVRNGVISSNLEVDAFKFSLTTTRTVNIQASERFTTVDPNLNLRVRVMNVTGLTTLYTSSPLGSTRVDFNVTLPAGTYFVYVDGVGENTPTTGYSSYGSLGYYNVVLRIV